MPLIIVHIKLLTQRIRNLKVNYGLKRIIIDWPTDHIIDNNLMIIVEKKSFDRQAYE